MKALVTDHSRGLLSARSLLRKSISPRVSLSLVLALCALLPSLVPAASSAEPVYNRFTGELIGNFDISPGADLGGVVLDYAELTNRNLSGADVSGSSMVNVGMYGVQLSNGNLSETDLQLSYLGYANFEDADFSGADLRKVSLRYSDFGGADFSGADFREADIHGNSGTPIYDGLTNFTGTTITPGGNTPFDPVAAGWTFVEAPSAGLDQGLVAHYPFSGNADDASGNGNDGVVHGATLTTDRFGNANSAYSFDGNSDFVSIDAHISGYPEFTQLAWIEFASPVSLGETKIIQIGIGGMMLDTALNELIFEIQADRDGGASNGSSPSTRYVYQLTAPDSAPGWSQLALTGHSDNSFSLYINGSQVYAGFGLNDAGQVGNYDNSLIGAGNRSQNPPGSEGSFFAGSIDDVRIYDRALSAEEVAELYATEPAVESCQGWLEAGETESGLYTIHPDGGAGIEVYCDMTTQGGGWTKGHLLPK